MTVSFCCILVYYFIWVDILYQEMDITTLNLHTGLYGSQVNKYQTKSSKFNDLYK